MAMAKIKTGGAPAAPFSYEGLDRVIHEKARLGILTALVSQSRGVLFGDLRKLCALTDGNLSRHLQVLVEAGYVEAIKSFHQNRPQTLCKITPVGRKSYMRYLEVLEQVVRDAAEAARSGKTLAGAGKHAPA